MGSNSTLRLRVSAVVSAAIHATILAALLIVARHGIVLLPAPDKPAQVELLMVEQKGAGNTTTPPAAAPSQDAPPARQQAAAAPPPSPPGSAETATPPPPPPQEADAEPLPAPPVPPEEPPADAKPAASPPAPASAEPAPPTPPTQVATPARAAPPAPAGTSAITFNLGGTDSESNALAAGDGIIPASPDNKHRNRPPIYPEDAALRGEQGSVILVVHVSPFGLPSGVDVLQSSGHPSLDRAAVQAVQAWRFLPAVKDGQAVPFDMPMRFMFTF
jgi:protein TonB